jgi:hypothetical protein
MILYFLTRAGHHGTGLGIYPSGHCKKQIKTPRSTLSTIREIEIEIISDSGFVLAHGHIIKENGVPEKSSLQILLR